MATSVTPRRQVRPKVSDTITPTSTPARARRPSRMRRAERSGSTGQQRGPAPLDVGQVDAGVGADEAVPGLGDDQVAAAAQDAHRLVVDQRLVGQRVVGVDRAPAGPRPWTRSSGSPPPRRRRPASASLGDEAGQVVAGPISPMPSTRIKRDAGHTGAFRPVGERPRRARAAASSGPDMRWGPPRSACPRPRPPRPGRRRPRR